MLNAIIIRAAGERTESECVAMAKKQGDVFIVRAEPFGAAIMETYLKALEINAKYTTVIDADVLIYDNVIAPAIKELEKRDKKIFCLDGKTNDKVMMCPRRAGIHIYKTDLLSIALDFIDFDALKPESNVRNEMAEIGYPTWSGKSLIFGDHDFEQYYNDLWRKSVCQAWKLERMINNRKIKNIWKEKSKHDNDFKVILAGNQWAVKNTKPEEIIIDKRKNFKSNENIKLIGLTEKEEMQNEGL